MAKYKIERNNGRTLLVVPGQKGQQISEREFYIINTVQIPCLVKADLIRKSNSFKLVYDISGYISLREYLFNPLNRFSFSRLLKNILDNLKTLQNSFFNEQYLLLDVNTVMVNPSTQELKFIYIPITFYENGISLKYFLLSIIDFCSFDQGETGDYIREYIRILNNGINFSVFDLEEYIKRTGQSSDAFSKENRCRKCGAEIGSNVNFCSYCGARVGELSVKSESIYDPSRSAFSRPVAPESDREHYNHYNPDDIYRASDDVPHSPPMPPSPPVPTRQSYGKTPAYDTESQSYGYIPYVNPERDYLQNESINETCGYASALTGVIGPEHSFRGNEKNPHLISVKTGERIKISGSVFSIGKDPYQNSYCIRNNSAVSRTHAVIKNQNGRWCISDLNSTNKTYVNGSEVFPGSDVDIFNNSRITFANEEYIFSFC